MQGAGYKIPAGRGSVFMPAREDGVTKPKPRSSEMRTPRVGYDRRSGPSVEGFLSCLDDPMGPCKWILYSDPVGWDTPVRRRAGRHTLRRASGIMHHGSGNSKP